ncbi:nucleotide exchange factor GrpE [Pelagibacteraceae bacterium]|nr:nucleotide exchange factor GrpE [Pelagibacteraceae bacterium]
MTENNKKKHDTPQVNEKIIREKVNVSDEVSKQPIDEEVNVSDEVSKQPIDKKLKDTEEKLLRSLAEIENQRRRFEKEIKDAFEFGSFNFAKESLAILDNLERAKLAIKNDEKLKINKDLDKFLENITIIEKDLVSIFERNRIKKIETKEKKFDPNFHQAMSEIVDEDAEPGTILQEIQAGYMLGERLLRPALVGVAKKELINNEKKEEK